MAIAYDNLSPDTLSTGNVSSLTSGSWTMGSGSNRIVFGFIGTGAGTPAAHSGMKWGGSGGTALTQIGSTLNIGSFLRASAWRLLAPSSGSNTIYGNWAAAQDETAIGGVSYSGVDQTTPVGTPVTATGSSTTASATVTTVAGDKVIALIWCGGTSAINPTFTPTGPSATARYDITNTQLGFEAMCVVEATATGTSTAIGATISAGATPTWGIIAFKVNAASVVNNPPNTPSITATTPTTNSVGITGSSFSDPDAGNTQLAAQWQVTLAADTGFASPVADSGTDTTHLTSYTATGLASSTAYIARVRYQDQSSSWSSYSSSSSFTTSATSGGDIYGISFPSNADSPTSPIVAIKFANADTNGLPMFGPSDAGVTIIREIKVRQQSAAPSNGSYYYAQFWYSTADGTFNPDYYYGFHPYPQSGNPGTDPNSYWELAGFGYGLDNYLTLASTSVAPTYGRLYTQALKVTKASTTKTGRFYLDLPAVSNGQVIQTAITSGTWGASPPAMSVTIGDSPWYATYQHERFSGVLGRIKIFATALSESDILAESGDMSQLVTSAGIASIWWGKTNFASVDDLTCNYGTGRSFSWADGSNKGTLALIYSGNAAASLSSTSTLAATGKLSLSGSASLASVSTVSVTGQVALRGAASLASISTLAGSARLSLQASASLASISTITATGQVGSAVQGSANLASTSTLAASGLLSLLASSSLASASTLAASGQVGTALSGAAILTSTSTLVGAGLVSLRGAASLGSASSLVASGQVGGPRLASASLVSVSTLTANVGSSGPVSVFPSAYQTVWNIL